MQDISKLEANRVFHFFEEISKIPRGSFNEKAISEYLCEFAKSHNLEYKTDEMYNVIIKKDASKGYENAPVVALQGHTDMVCEKNSDVTHNFLTEGIKIIYERDLIKADRTTLGGDNGIAVAMALAILEAKDIKHPPIEAIFTTCEEVGMDGAMALDTSNLKANIFLNLDSDSEGTFTVGCAGGAKADIEIPIKYEQIEIEIETYKLGIYGLFGGHSGIDVTKGRGNSNILLARTINTLCKDINIYLNSIWGGSKDNAIPREAEAIVSIKPNDYDKLYSLVCEIDKIYKQEYTNTDTGVNIKLEKIDKNNLAFDAESKNRVIQAILILPNGIQTMSTDIEGLVESSVNVGVVQTDGEIIKITSSVRSAVHSKKVFIIDKIKICVDALGGIVNFRGDYPAWEYNKNSQIREKCIQAYKEMYNQNPKVEIIHAGLECGLFYEKMPQLDIISFGPDLQDIHTPDETASISSINRVWVFLNKLLQDIK